MTSLSTPSSVHTVGQSYVSPWLMTLLYPMGRLFLHLYFGEIAIAGTEHLTTSGPVVLAPTHRSRWDAILLSLAAGRLTTGRDLRFMVTQSEVTGIQGWFIRRLGGFPIDIRRVDVGSLSFSVALLQQGEMLVVFPEGGIFRDRTVHPLKRGIGRIAMDVVKRNTDTSLKIIPTTIKYSDTYPKYGTNVEIIFGEGIVANQFDVRYPKTSSQKLTCCLHERLADLYESYS